MAKKTPNNIIVINTFISSPSYGPCLAIFLLAGRIPYHTMIECSHNNIIKIVLGEEGRLIYNEFLQTIQEASPHRKETKEVQLATSEHNWRQM